METLVQNIITEFVGKMGVKIDAIEPISVAAHHMFNIRTVDSKRLIGPQGDHLRALNFLLRRYAERIPELKDEKFLVDVNGYHMVRIRDIENKARILADRVRAFRSSAEMTPMNSYERMIIHAMYRSATVWSRMSSAVADSGTVQANTSLAMAPKPRLFFLSTTFTAHRSLAHPKKPASVRLVQRGSRGTV